MGAAVTTAMQPPVRTITLPAEVADLIRDAQVDELTGTVTLHFRAGGILAAELTRRIDLHRRGT
jgi:hypothetical protein